MHARSLKINHCNSIDCVGLCKIIHYADNFMYTHSLMDGCAAMKSQLTVIVEKSPIQRNDYNYNIIAYVIAI